MSTSSLGSLLMMGVEVPSSEIQIANDQFQVGQRLFDVLPSRGRAGAMTIKPSNHMIGPSFLKLELEVILERTTPDSVPMYVPIIIPKHFGTAEFFGFNESWK